MNGRGDEIRRGEVWWAGLPESAASEPGYQRPVLVVSADGFNRSRIRTAIAAALTTNLELAWAPGNVRVAAEEAGLPKDSPVNVSQVARLRISQNGEGANIRRRPLDRTRELVAGARAFGFAVDNNEMFPLVSVKLGYVPEVIEACKILWGHGIPITPALFPAVPLDCGALRFTVTAANTEEQVRSALEALRMVREKLFPSEEPPPLAAAADTI